MTLYRSPLTVTLWPSSFLKKYGPMIPPAYKALQTVIFSGCNGVSTYTWISLTPNAVVLFVDLAIQPEDGRCAVLLARWIVPRAPLEIVGSSGHKVPTRGKSGLERPGSPRGPLLNDLPGAIFQQDNARPHTARFAQDFLRHFQILPLPALSADLSAVEHVWYQLKRQIPSCHSVHDLELAVQNLWAHLPQDNIRCRINSMPYRVVTCIAAGSGPTRY
ncbi:transposable element Tcb2 transposase [Trichonephila clavipes]|nr:transposable element Tcb2 transposase [Trichonephila clavipes]